MNGVWGTWQQNAPFIFMINSSKKHLEEIDESYFQHMKNALKISFEMLVGSFMAIIHSVIPAIFKTGASTKIKDLYIFTQERLTRNKKNNTGQKNTLKL